MLDEHDHRSLGQRLDLFHFQEEGPGMVFWHPRGWRLYELLQHEVRRHVDAEGYREVRSPQLLGQRIWEGSGHWQHFRGNMFLLPDGASAFKPVSCPGHIQIIQRMSLSLRDLPVRLSEFGLVHRNEPSGALHGLFRLRQFCQDDGHIFCAEEHVADEVARFCASLKAFYGQFGFSEVGVGFSGRPEDRAGSDEVWARAEALLLDAAQRAGVSPRLQPGEGAFYGPKLEFSLKDRLGRQWQCGVIQLDLVMPESFGLHYAAANGERRVPVMLHRALFGSLERFIGVLLEHYRGALPPWLCPEQAMVVPIGSEVRGYAEEVRARLIAAGVRACWDDREESLSRKVSQAHELGIPFIVVVGKREQASRSVRIRERGGRQRDSSLDEAVVELVAAGVR